MCLLCVRMPDTPVNTEYLANANANNADGFGFAILRSDLSAIDTFCTMDGDLAISKYVEAVERDPKCWSMYHARLATHGSETVENVHPFRVGGSKKTVLAHNGILPIPASGKRSDTRIFAESILPSMGLDSLDDSRATNALEKWCAGSKIAIFSIDPRLKHNIYILNEDDGQWDKEGTWWSNNSYSYRWGFGGYGSCRTTNFPLIGSTSKNEPADDASMYDDVCLICKAFLYDDDYEMVLCGTCQCCLDCAENIEDCLCYVPTRTRLPKQLTIGH